MKMKRRRTCLIPKMSLPNEIIINILVRLRAKSISRLKSVSKNWCSLLSDPYFIKLHNNFSIQHDKFSLILNYCNELYSIDSDSLTSQNPLHIDDYPSLPFKHKLIFVGSCNGLVCFIHNLSYAINRIYFWNPSTGECKRLPSSQRPSSYIRYGFRFSDDSAGCGFGFYYDSKLDDYKLLKIKCSKSTRTTVELYSLGSNSWKELVFHDIPYKISGNNGGVFVNGALHWKATKSLGSNVILSFDVVDEIFKQVSVPEVVMNQNLSEYMEIGVLSDNLCLFDNSGKFSTGLWVMKDYGMSESWTKLLTFSNNKWIETIFPLKCFSNGDILFHRDWNELVLYSKKKNTTFPKLTLGDFEVVTCADNLVSLNSRRYFKQELEKT